MPRTTGESINNEVSELQNGQRGEASLSHLYARLNCAIKHCSDFITS